MYKIVWKLLKISRQEVWENGWRTTFVLVEIVQNEIGLPFGDEVGRTWSAWTHTTLCDDRVRSSWTDSELLSDCHNKSQRRCNKRFAGMRLALTLLETLDYKTYILVIVHFHFKDKRGASVAKWATCLHVWIKMPFFHSLNQFATFRFLSGFKRCGTQVVFKKGPYG